MKTNTVIIGLVLAAIAIGAGIYLIYGNDAEKITVEIEVEGEFASWVRDGVPVVGATIDFTWTSSEEDLIYSDYPDVVFEKEGEQKRFSSTNISKRTSGQTIPIRVSYNTGTPFDPKGWDYHFELSDYMKRQGNFKIVEL